VIPPVSIDGPTLTIRKFRKDKLAISKLIELGTLTEGMAEFLRAWWAWVPTVEITGGGAAVSLDALGHPTTCRNSIRCLARRGRHIQIGLTLGNHKDIPIPMNEVIAKELEIRGSHGMQAHRFADLLGMITSGVLDPARLIGKRVSLAEAPAELDAMTRFEQEGISVIDRF
jgi:alcohol dehydrogenase